MKSTPPDLTRQIEIIHLSDIHFGSSHRFRTSKSASGDCPKDEGYPTLAEKLIEDLPNIKKGCPTIICITGDLVNSADVEEFNQVEEFIENLLASPKLAYIKKKDLYIIPGNHDVNYRAKDTKNRFQQYINFYDRIYSKNARRNISQDCQMVFDESKTQGYIVVCINSCKYVQKGTEDEKRGRINVRDLDKISSKLCKIPKKQLENSIKIALIHHHPVLIPSLVEPDKGYDAVYNSEKLIQILKDFGFHAILHGHKHNPHTFTEDIKPAYQNNIDSSMLIIAGGSIGSIELPSNPNCMNTYNRVLIKLHPKGKQYRIRVETRSLKMYNSKRTLELPTRWKWTLMNVDDRHFVAENNLPLIANNLHIKKFESADKKDDKNRIKYYEKSRGNLPVVNVLPSLEPDQAYEAMIWIVQHPYGVKKPIKDCPVKVIYSAGERFEVIEVNKNENDNFIAKFTYYGPMLIQVKMIFKDKKEFITHIYARMPNQF